MPSTELHAKSVWSMAHVSVLSSSFGLYLIVKIKKEIMKYN